MRKKINWFQRERDLTGQEDFQVASQPSAGMFWYKFISYSVYWFLAFHFSSDTYKWWGLHISLLQERTEMRDKTAKLLVLPVVA